jgi:competence protein ComEA
LFQVDRKQQLVIIAIAAVFLFTAGYKVSRWQAQGGEYPGQAKVEDVVESGGFQAVREIVVHVAGAVKNPGVYTFSTEARVKDALERAVPLDRADIQSLNLAAPLKDGQKIVVPLKQDNSGAAGQVAQQGAAGAGEPARININRASAGELETLPGFGPALSQRVVNYRESNGFFASEEDIKNVQGIGDKIYNQIKDQITVN